jgi:hypothetical protein
MPTMPDRLAKVDAWLDRETARQNTIIKLRPAWWHAGKVLLGLLLIARSLGLAIDASGPGSFALAFLLVAGGTAFVFEGGQMLWRRWAARRG